MTRKWKGTCMRLFHTFGVHNDHDGYEKWENQLEIFFSNIAPRHLSRSVIMPK